MKSNYRYFEITIDQPAIMGIGLIDVDTFVEEYNNYCGKLKGSIGYFNDTGSIHFESNKPCAFMPPFAVKENERHVVGCGFNTETKEVFFTHNGVKGYSTTCEWNEIEAVLSLYVVDKITINYGDEPFMYHIDYEEPSLEND